MPRDETNATGRAVLGTMVENIAVAEKRQNLLCQDTGIPIYNVVIGRDVEFDGADLKDAIRRGCARATTEHPCAPRWSIRSPARTSRPPAASACRSSTWISTTGDETVSVEMIPKGSGSENGSFLQMLMPADGINAIKRFVIDRVIELGGRVCPPTIVGVGIGGTSDLCMHLAKVAATRPLRTACSDPEGARIEAELSRAVNELGIGPQGLGGRSTSFARPCRDRRDPHHPEPGGGEHPVPLGAPRPGDLTPGGIAFD